MAAASPNGQGAAATPHPAAVAASVSARQEPTDIDALTLTPTCAAAFRDKRLSLMAMGLLGLLATHEADSGDMAEAIAEYATDSVPAIRTALGELEEFGYLVRDRSEGPDGMRGPGSYRLAGEIAPPRMKATEAQEDAPRAFDGAAEERVPRAGSSVRAKTSGCEPVDGAAHEGLASGGSFLVSSRVQGVLLAFPDAFREALRTTARTDRPRVLVTAIERELRIASPNRLADRIRRRWVTRGYGRLLAVGALKRPVGVAVAMVRSGPCPDPRCEDGQLEEGTPCRACAEREKDRRSELAGHRGTMRQAVPASCSYCGAGVSSDGESCDACVSGTEAVAEEVAELVEEAVRGWAATAGVSVAEAREAVERAVSRARTDATEAGASPAGQALAARLAALEEIRRIRTAGDGTGGGSQAGLGAVTGRRSHSGAGSDRPDVARGPDACAGADSSGCPEGRAAVGSTGLCVRCRRRVVESQARGDVGGTS